VQGIPFSPSRPRSYPAFPSPEAAVYVERERRLERVGKLDGERKLESERKLAREEERDEFCNSFFRQYCR